MRSFLKPGKIGGMYWSVGVPAAGPNSRMSLVRSTAKLTACRRRALFLKSGRFVLSMNILRNVPGTEKNCDLLTP